VAVALILQIGEGRVGRSGYHAHPLMTEIYPLWIVCQVKMDKIMNRHREKRSPFDKRSGEAIQVSHAALDCFAFGNDGGFP
jgi:hypothetical protein